MVTKYRFNLYEMHCEWKEKLRSHNTSYCLIEVVTKAGLIVYLYLLYTRLPILSSCIYFVPSYVFFYLAAHILFFGHSFIVLNYNHTTFITYSFLYLFILVCRFSYHPDIARL